MDTHLLWDKGVRVFRIWGEGPISHLHFLSSFTQGKSKFSPPLVGSYLAWNTGALPSLILFQKDGSQVFEKDTPGKRLLKRSVSQRGRERIHNFKFSKVSTLRKEKWRPSTRKDTGESFVKLRGMLRLSWSPHGNVWPPKIKHHTYVVRCFNCFFLFLFKGISFLINKMI